MKKVEKKAKGRPIERGARADRQFKMMVTPDEHELFREAAEAAGTTMAKWIIPSVVKSAKR